MAKEGDLKKVDLKVTVNCCEGCKRKVKKALQSIEGVYKVQIDVYQPKVTITGNVDTQTLVKKLARIGKAAEPWPGESQKPMKEEKKVQSSVKEVESTTENVKDKAKDGDGGKKTDNKGCKCSSPCCAAKSTENESSESGSNKKEEKKDAKGADCGNIYSGSLPEVTKNAIPVPQPGIVHEGVSVASYTPYYYTIEPPTVPPAYYRVAAYMVPPSYYVRDQYCDVQVPLPPVQSQAPRLTDYFDDDNTIGCSIM